MKPEELKLITQLIELAGDIGALKAELEAVKRENEYLRGLLTDKLNSV